MTMQNDIVAGVAFLGTDTMPCRAFGVHQRYGESVSARIGIECDADQFSRIAPQKAFDRITIEYHGKGKSQFERWTLFNVRDIEGTYSPPLAAMYVSAERCIAELVDNA